jgi:small subunit ribosomal protein S7
MPRRRVPKRRVITKDPRFDSELISVFVNAIMRSGKKGLAYKIVYGALNLVKEHFVTANRLSDDSFRNASSRYRKALHLEENDMIPDAKIALVIFARSIENVQPQVEVRSNRVGGDTRQVPRPVTQARGRALAFRFLKKAALLRKANASFEAGDKGMAKLLALEVIDAYDGKGGAVKMCTDVHRMAKANQAYVYMRPSATSESITI